MSASNKKKLRKEIDAEMMTERQKQELKEAKKLKLITVSFVVVMLAIFLTTATLLTIRGINGSGIIEKNTTAITIDGTKINSVQMNYYLRDVIQTQYNSWKNSFGDNTNTYLGYLYGLDVNAPLNEQKYQGSDSTWADQFVNQAISKARNDYALYNAAVAAGFQLPEEDKANIETTISTMTMYGSIYGYKNANQYLKSLYGPGSSEKSYRQYLETSALASAYYNHYSESLTYLPEQLRAHEADKALNYTSFDYATYTVEVEHYLEGGTEAEDGSIEYTDEQKAAAVKKAEEAANSLITSTDLTALNKAIEGLEFAEGHADHAATKATEKKNTLYTSVPEDYKEWLSKTERVENEMTVIDVKEEKEDDTEEVTGYTVLVFLGRNENNNKMANVRHLLVSFEGGTTNSTTGEKKYSDAEKAAAKAEADAILAAWDKTEASFINLIKEKSDDTGSVEDGGLFTNINPQSSYVENFLNWAIDPERKVGDYGIVETEYGYHIMYFSSYTDITYRDYMIQEELREADLEKWYNAIIEKVVVVTVKTSRLRTDLTVASIAGSY